MGGVPCQYLEYENQKAECKVYNDMPKACREFLCSNPEWQNREIQDGLRGARGELEKGLITLDDKRVIWIK